MLIDTLLVATDTKAETRLKVPLTLISKSFHRFSGSAFVTERRSGMYPELAMRISTAPTAELMDWKALSRELVSTMSPTYE